MALKVFREIEPNRSIIYIFEDIDSIIEHHGEDEILSVLDGEMQVNKVLNIATTNYPERLDRRIVGSAPPVRPSYKNRNAERSYKKALLLHQTFYNGEGSGRMGKKDQRVQFRSNGRASHQCQVSWARFG